jgi:REP element-mobilizing transposase RayT
MSQPVPLLPGHTYHIFNRGNNRENIFREARNYPYFLELYAQHVMPVVDTFAYCLMRNHFHLLVQLKAEAETNDSKQTNTSRAFANFFSAYTKAINKGYLRTGSLFEKPFRRIEVTSDNYFTNLIFYIHFNPQKHGFVDDFREWPWSSFGAMLNQMPSKLQRQGVLNWFGGVDRFKSFHQGAVDEKMIRHLIEEDFD